MQKPIEIASQLSRAAREAAAAVLGQRGIFRTLKGEHAELRTLMHRCARTHASGRSLALRRELFQKIRAKLLADLEAEQRELHPVLAQHELTRDRTRQSVARHHRIEVMLQELSLLRCDAPEWIHRFDELVGDATAYMEDEEAELFPLAERALTPERVREIDRRFRMEKIRTLRTLAAALH